jgi:hypothetical protein
MLKAWKGGSRSEAQLTVDRQPLRTKSRGVRAMGVCEW